MALVEKGITKEHNFYAYCARKLRTLMANFPCVRIGIDQEGGGRAVVEALHDKDKLLEGEQLLWPIIDPDKESPTDLKEGSHIVELINFSKVDWVNEANHGLKKDFEDKVTLFPRYDNLSLGLANEIDLQRAKSKKTPSDEEVDINRLTGVDSLEEIISEIEEIKNELCLIVHTKTDISGRDRWDTPQIKNATGRIGRMRKDRYSALIIANMIARQINRADAPLSFNIGRVPKFETLPTKKPKTVGSFYQVPWNTFVGIKRR